jgi:hypothetical protein
VPNSTNSETNAITSQMTQEVKEGQGKALALMAKKLFSKEQEATELSPT